MDESCSKNRLEYKHDRSWILITLVIWIGICSYGVIRLVSWSSIGHKDLFIVLIGAVLAVLAVLLAIALCREKIAIDLQRGVVVLQYMLYPTHFFDILIKRRAEIPLREIVSVKHVSGQRFKYVYTIRGRFTIPSSDEFSEIEQILKEAALENEHPTSSAQERNKWFHYGVLCVMLLLVLGAVVYLAWP